MALRWAPRFEYGVGFASVVVLTYSMRPLTPIKQDVGGGTVAGSGVPETYVVRRDYMLTLSLRVLEAEWPLIVDMVNVCHDLGSLGQIRFYPDPEGSPLTFYTGWLQKPEPGDEFTPTERDQQYLGLFTVEITLRLLAGSAIPDIRMMTPL